MPLRHLPVLLGVASFPMEPEGQYQTHQCYLCSLGRRGMSYQAVLSVPHEPRTPTAPLCQSDMGTQGIRDLTLTCVTGWRQQQR